MLEGSPIKRNLCNECKRPNPVGQTKCTHCGGVCDPKIVGYFKGDEEETPDFNDVVTHSDGTKRIIGL